MSVNRSHLPIFIIVAVLSTLLGAGSVVAAVSFSLAASALTNYDFDTSASKTIDLGRALAAGGNSPDRVVVTYTNAFADQATLKSVHALVGGVPLSGNAVLGREVFRVAAGDAGSAVDRLRGQTGVSEARVEHTVSADKQLEKPTPLPNRAAPSAKSAASKSSAAGVHAAQVYPAITNDPFRAEAWGVTRIGANQVWNTSDGSGVKVAILDCGIHATHPDLAGKVGLQYDFSGSSSTDDLCNHGTHVAGTVAALTNNLVGVQSVAPGVQLMNGKVLDDNGNGLSTWAEDGIQWAVDNGARVVNLSLGGDAPCPASTQAVVNYAHSKNVVIVAAAGNDAVSHADSPANCASVVSVGAVDQTDKKAGFSNTGTNVVLAAPGVAIGSSINPDINAGSQYGLMSGTSMASPHVAGAVALVWGTCYGISPDVVVSRLESTAVRITGTGSLWTYGRVDALKAVGLPGTLCVAPTPTPSPTSTTAPTATPTTTPTVGPSPTPTWTPTAAPSAAPTNTPTVGPSPTPTWTPTASPTATALNTPTAGPSPTPTRTTAPTRAPTATRTPIPARVSPTPVPCRAPAMPPSTVKAVTLSRGQSVQLTWKAGWSACPTTFDIFRGDMYGVYGRALTYIGSTTTPSYKDIALPPGQAWVTYFIVARNASGQSRMSAPVHNTTILH